MSDEHQVAGIVGAWGERCVCTCGLVALPNYELGGYDGGDGVHFLSFAVVGAASDDSAPPPFDTAPASADDPDAPEPPRERVAPLPMMQPSSVPVDDVQAARDARNAADRAKRARAFQLRVQAGQRGRGPVPRGV